MFAGKASFATFCTPSLFLDALRSQGWHPGEVPRAVILTYARFEHYLATVPELYTPNHMLGSGPNRFFLVNETDGEVAINCLGIGAPAAVNQIALQAELGVRGFLTVGTAGGLQADLVPGDIVVATEGVRDEGSSYHFLAPDEPAEPSPQLTDRLRAELDRAGISHRAGPTWTIDVPFRETGEERSATTEATASRPSRWKPPPCSPQRATTTLLLLLLRLSLSTGSRTPTPNKRWSLDLAAADTRLRELLRIAIRTLATEG